MGGARPRRRRAARRADLAGLARDDLVAVVADDAHADEHHVELGAGRADDTPDGALRDTALAEEAVDPGCHLGAMGQRGRRAGRGG